MDFGTDTDPIFFDPGIPDWTDFPLEDFAPSAPAPAPFQTGFQHQYRGFPQAPRKTRKETRKERSSSSLSKTSKALTFDQSSDSDKTDAKSDEDTDVSAESDSDTTQPQKKHAKRTTTTATTASQEVQLRNEATLKQMAKLHAQSLELQQKVDAQLARASKHTSKQSKQVRADNKKRKAANASLKKEKKLKNKDPRHHKTKKKPESPPQALLPGFSFNPLKKSKKSKKRSTGKHKPPILTPGSIVQVKPSSSISLVVGVQRDGRDGPDEEETCWVVDVGSCKLAAFKREDFCCVPDRYFERFSTSGRIHLPPFGVSPQSWIWSFISDEVNQVKTRYSVESSAILSHAYASQQIFSVYLPFERHSVMLISIFGLFAVTNAGPDEPYFKYRVILSY